MAAQVDMLRSKGFCTTAEAADVLGVHLTTIYRAMERGDLKGTQIGRKRYVDVESLAGFAKHSDTHALAKLDALRKLVLSVRRAVRRAP